MELTIGMRRLIGAAGAAVALALIVTPLHAQTMPTTSDPRVGLKAGRTDAGEVLKGMRLVSFTPKPPQFDSTRGLAFANSDLAFRGNYVYQGNFRGFTIWDVSNKSRPVRMSTYVCATSQGDPSIYGNLLFISAEGNNRNDCGTGNVDPGPERMMGVRIFDVSDPRNPRLVKNVNNCKGSHTHTLIPHPTDRNVVYIYISGSNNPRPDLEGCQVPPDDPNSPQRRLDIIKVPLNNPDQAAVIGGARVFDNFEAAASRVTPRPNMNPGRGGAAGGRGGRGADTTVGRAGGRVGRGAIDTTGGRGAGAGGRGAGRGGAGGPAPIGPANCHDVTAYPEMNLLAGACQSRGILVDISDPENPVRLDAAADTNFGLWHTAVFSNDGKKVVFTDEWGGGTGAMCQAISPLELGANTVLTIGEDKKFRQHAYFKMPAAQTAQENCVSHNGSLIPVPGRDIMVQGWYQGGVNVFDFTDPDRPVEIAYFDRGPLDSVIVTAGSWGAYWYNGYIYSSEIARGFDILELVPSEHLTANEIEAAKLVQLDQFNPQSQPKIVWPAAFPVVRAYLDQLVRGRGLPAARTAAITNELAAAERLTGAARRDALNRLATALDGDAASSSDAAKVRTMAAAVRELAAASR